MNQNQHTSLSNTACRVKTLGLRSGPDTSESSQTGTSAPSVRGQTRGLEGQSELSPEGESSGKQKTGLSTPEPSRPDWLLTVRLALQQGGWMGVGGSRVHPA